jgi:hypothetical protein
MALTQALQDERKRLLGELAKVDKAIQMFGGSAAKASAYRMTPIPRTPEASRVSKAAQGLRWAKQLKKGATAIAAAKKELADAQKALAASKKEK